MQTYEEKFENVKYYHSLLKWFDKQKIEKSFKHLFEKINDLSRIKKLNSLMHLYFVDRSAFPQDFNVYSIISECLSDNMHSLDLISKYQKKLKGEKNFVKVKSDINMFFQFLNMELGNYIKAPKEFASVINNYFSILSEKKIDNNELKMEYLGFCTLPSIFGFFSIPDFYQYVYQLSSNFIKMDSLNILSDYFCASFFFNTPKFLNFLWDDYFHQFLTSTTKYSPFKYYDFFIQSLKKASNFLVTYHYLIVKQIYDISPERLVRMLIKLVFLPTLEIRIISDASSHIYEIDQISCFTSLKYVFNYILERPFLKGFARSLLNALKIQTDTEPNSQYIYPLKIVKFYCYTSIRELVFFANVFSISEPNKNKSLYKHDQFPEIILQDNSIIYNELYFNKPTNYQEIKPNWNTILYQEDKLFVQNSQEIEIKDENENFFRIYSKFKSTLNEKGINIVSVIDDRFPIAQDKKSIVDYYKKCHPILKDAEFKDFVITKIYNEYCNFFKTLENKMIINNITESIYQDDLDSVNRLYFMSLNAFIVFDDCFSTKSMRYKLASLPSIKEEMFDEILKYLLSFTMRYSHSIFEVFSVMSSRDENENKNGIFGRNNKNSLTNNNSKFTKSDFNSSNNSNNTNDNSNSISNFISNNSNSNSINNNNSNNANFNSNNSKNNGNSTNNNSNNSNNTNFNSNNGKNNDNSINNNSNNSSNTNFNSNNGKNNDNINSNNTNFNNGKFDNSHNNNDKDRFIIESNGGSVNCCGNGFNIFELDAFKNMKFLNVHFAFKKIQQLKNIASFVVKMEMVDRIVIYSKLFRYVHEFILAQDSYSSVKEIDSVSDYDDDYYHHSMLIIIYLFCQIDHLINLYETYCTFFKYAFSQFDDDDDKEINEVKSDWIRFQNVLKKTLFKENEESMKLCFIE